MKKIFKIDIGDIPPSEVDAYMEKMINKMKKVPYMEPSGSQGYNCRFDLSHMTEDIWVPIRDNVIPLSENDILKIATKSSKTIGLPKRTPVKNFLLGLRSEIYLRLLSVGVKLGIVNFHTLEAYCFNREYFLDSDWKGQRAL